MTTPVKFEVHPTSITGHSLLVLPDPGHHTPKLSLQMETDLAKRLAHAANVLPELTNAVREMKTVAAEYNRLVDKYPAYPSEPCDARDAWDEYKKRSDVAELRLDAALAAAEEVKMKP